MAADRIPIPCKGKEGSHQLVRTHVAWTSPMHLVRGSRPSSHGSIWPAWMWLEWCGSGALLCIHGSTKKSGGACYDVA